VFGIIRPCRHRMSQGMAATWLAHLCGLCLALRDGHGQFARVATNYDGLVVSVLVEAQSPGTADRGAGRRTAGPCPLRGMRTAPVAMGEGARLAAAVSLVLASVKVRDHVEDRDGLFGRRPVAAAARGVARRWDRAGAATGDRLGFDTAVLVEAAGRQSGIEAAAGPGTSVLTVTEPTETATAAVFAHTAVLAGRPHNAEPLAEAGRLFGRLAHLLDAVEDLAEDTRTGAWNPLTATGTPLTEARRLCDDALHGIRLALRDVEFTRTSSGRLAHTLLAHELARSVDRAFAGGTCSHQCPDQRPDQDQVRYQDGSQGPAAANPYRGDPSTDNPYAPGGPGLPGDVPPPPEPPRRRGLLAGCLAYTGLCCTCRLCCTEHDDAWTGQRREAWCSSCDCDCCDGCDTCGDCCQCCDSCDGCDCGCDC
jgi:hypothetical protein